MSDFLAIPLVFVVIPLLYTKLMLTALLPRGVEPGWVDALKVYVGGVIGTLLLWFPVTFAISYLPDFAGSDWVMTAILFGTVGTGFALSGKVTIPNLGAKKMAFLGMFGALLVALAIYAILSSGTGTMMIF